MTKHLLVTNDFPPKIGGIQQYLWELWRRLDPSDVTVLTTPYRGDHEFDRRQPFRVVRTRQKWLLPTGALVAQINGLARQVGAEIIVLDPAVPLGILGPRLSLPYVVVGHGAEFVIPSQLPVSRSVVRRIVECSAGSIASGEYVARSMRRVSGGDVEIGVIPPGVDIERFEPASEEKRHEVRRRWHVGDDKVLVLGVSRLVPRKGFDRVIAAVGQIPEVEVLIAGRGREARRLQRQIDSTGSPVRLLGRVDDVDLRDLYGAADIFVMACHDRWFGLEREGYGIVFAEAAAAGVPSIAGNSGGSGEAVLDGVTGYVTSSRAEPAEVAHSIRLLLDPVRRRQMGAAARQRAETEQSYDKLARELSMFLDRVAERAG